MNKLISAHVIFSLIVSVLFLFSCEKEAAVDAIASDDGHQERLAYIEKGYTEFEVIPIIKLVCYFPDWNNEIMTPISGYFEYYDGAKNLVASINFGVGSCDYWVTKNWDVNVFTDYPSGNNEFSLFDYKDKR